MKRLIFGTLACLLALTIAGCSTYRNIATKDLYQASVDYKIVDGVIVLDEPERVKGQTSVLEFRAEPLETVRVGFVGLGMRGPGAVERFT